MYHRCIQYSMANTMQNIIKYDMQYTMQNTMTYRQ